MHHGVVRKKFELTEDQLTSTVFAYLDLLPPELFARWLSKATPVHESAASLAFTELASFERFLWPRTVKHGEPDLLVLTRDGGMRRAIVVEAKYGAPKSQWTSLMDDTDDYLRHAYDQLMRYGSALRTGDFPGIPEHELWGTEHAVVYLTADGAPPVSAMRESLQRDPGLPLYWLSWYALTRELEHVEHFDTTQLRAAAALREMLVALGFEVFSDFSSRTGRVMPHVTWHFAREFFALDADRLVTPKLSWIFSHKGAIS